MDCDSLAVPVRLAFASGGSGTILQMQGELLQRKGGVRFIHVLYKGDTPALAVTSAVRLKALPDVPPWPRPAWSAARPGNWASCRNPTPPSGPNSSARPASRPTDARTSS